MKLNVGCGPHRAAGWTNTDLVRVEGHIEPDLIVTREDPLPFEQGQFERVYIGHCLEHIPWGLVPGFLDKLAWVVEPGGHVMFVGPDVWRAMDGYRDGKATAHNVAVVMEERSAYTEELGFDEMIRWDSDRHHWNCHEQRVVDILGSCGWRKIVPHGVGKDGTLPESLEITGWPVVSRAPFQFAVSAKPPRTGIPTGE